MPSVEVDCLEQKAVLWSAVLGSFDRHGKQKVSAAVEIDVRWITGNKEVTDSKGNTIGIESTVIVDRAIPVQSILWLGKLSNLPSPTTNLRKVDVVKETPDIKGRATRRVLFLNKFSDTLPDIV